MMISKRVRAHLRIGRRISERHRVCESIRVKCIYCDENLGMVRIKGELTFHSSLCILSVRIGECSKGEFAKIPNDILIWCAALHPVERYLTMKPLFDWILKFGISKMVVSFTATPLVVEITEGEQWRHKSLYSLSNWRHKGCWYKLELWRHKCILISSL